MAGEEHRMSHHEDEDLAEARQLEAAVGEVAYEVWQENGRDEDLEKLAERMSIEYSEQHAGKSRDEMPGWAIMVADKLESWKT